jgi:DNA-binding response OmpR family regulator
MRRAEGRQPSATTIEAEGISLDIQSRRVTASGDRIDLTPSEFALLHTLMASPGRAFSRLELLEAVQGSSYAGLERTIDVHVRNLRSKIEPDPKAPRLIETVYGVGYRFAD